MSAPPTDPEPLETEEVKALEVERDFLLRSLDDLEREREAGDLGESDYHSLKDDYTARAAAVLRSITDARAGASASPSTPPSPRRRGATIAWIAVVVLVGVLAGIFVARSAGQRDEGDTATGGVREQVATRLAEGEELARQGDFDGAIEKFDEVLAEEPANAQALTAKGAVLIGDDQVEEGIASLREAIEVEPAFLDPWAILLVALNERGRADEALVDVGELVSGGDTDIALGVAEQLIRVDPLLAVKVYDQILEVEPDQARALTYRGWTLHLVAQEEGAPADLDEEALAYLDRAVAADPELSDALAFRAIVLKELGRIDEARAALAAFDASDPPEIMQTIVDQTGLREELAG
jgi:tetratricopeptide (TPR) repeat protein